MDTQKPVTKTEVRRAIKDVRDALRYAEDALDAGDWAGVVEALGYWAAPSAGTVSYDIEISHNIKR